jgi:uncharacterized membrane protein YoaK (UPF0700 family)
VAQERDTAIRPGGIRRHPRRLAAKTEMPRLVGVLVGLVTGAVAGGLLVLHARSYAPALPLVITVLVILTSELRRRRQRATVDQLVRRKA